MLKIQKTILHSLTLKTVKEFTFVVSAFVSATHLRRIDETSFLSFAKPDSNDYLFDYSWLEEEDLLNHLMCVLAQQFRDAHWTKFCKGNKSLITFCKHLLALATKDVSQLLCFSVLGMFFL